MNITDNMILAIRRDHPSLSIKALLAAVPPHATSPAAYLRSLVAKAAADPSKWSSDPMELPEGLGSFRADGSWSPRLERGHRYQLIMGLVSSRCRSDQQYSPRDFAIRISQHPDPEMLPMFSRFTLKAWAKLKTHAKWYEAPAVRASESAVKYASKPWVDIRPVSEQVHGSP